MRSLKFRVWGLYGDEYTYIDEENQAEAESFWDKSCIAILDEKHIVKCGTDEDGDGEGYEYCDVEEVETIEQYTGLKDKNGKEIYEGDIVSEEFVYCGEKTKTIWQVRWCDDECAFELRHVSGLKVDDCSLIADDKEDYEVIGNIHENPDLLEQENAKD